MLCVGWKSSWPRTRPLPRTWNCFDACWTVDRGLGASMLFLSTFAGYDPRPVQVRIRSPALFAGGWVYAAGGRLSDQSRLYCLYVKRKKQCHEAHDRTFGAQRRTGSCSKCRRTAQHHSYSLQRLNRRQRQRLGADRHRYGSDGSGADQGGGGDVWRCHGFSPYPLRHRAQAAGRG